MYQKVYQLLTRKFNFTNIITLDDIYDISDENNINIISFYKSIIKLIHEGKIEKVFILNIDDKQILRDKRSNDTEFALIKKRNKNTVKTLLQKDITNLLKSF